MNRASPADLRLSMEAVDCMVKAGVNFVPVPILSIDHQAELIEQMKTALETMEKGND